MKEMKKCELCDSLAKMYCESDQASLCWHCDAYVHSANFLVSKHIRNLLCNVCQSVTLWTGTGPMLVPTVSRCNSCSSNWHRKREIGNELDQVGDNIYGDKKEDDGSYDADEEEKENQVVPESSQPGSMSSGETEESSSRVSDNGGGDHQ